MGGRLLCALCLFCLLVVARGSAGFFWQSPLSNTKQHTPSSETPKPFKETSAAALRRVPYAQQEVLRLQSESAALATGAAALLAATAADAAAAGAAAAPLAAMHSVKVRMEAACATLKEATELSGAFRQVGVLGVCDGCVMGEGGR